MIEFEIKVDTLTPALKQAHDLMEDLSPLMRDFGEYLVVATKDRFPAGVAPDGGKWAPKSPTTLAAYGQRKSNRIDIRPLYGPTGLLSKLIFYEADRDSVTVGSNLVYAAVMQMGAAKGAFGTTSRGAPIPWGNIPARPFLGVSAEDERQLVEIAEEALERIADR